VTRAARPAANARYHTSHVGFLTHLPEVLGVMREFIDRRTIE
jgi:hypothetical protein